MHYIETRTLTDALVQNIEALERHCQTKENVQFKFELAYKRAASESEAGPSGQDTEKKAFPLEYFAFEGQELVGYLGLSPYGGSPEINGLVHPDYRRQGIFTTLWGKALAALKSNTYNSVLFLTDHASPSGTQWSLKTGGTLEHSEFEMKRLAAYRNEIDAFSIDSLRFRPAMNADAEEIAFQNSLYFGMRIEDVPQLLPEEEAAKGMQVYLIESQDQVVGKIHLQPDGGTGWIYGLGIKPDFRGQGYGRAALIWAVNQFRLQGLELVGLQVESENDNALSLYEKSGFVTSYRMDYYQYLL